MVRATTAQTHGALSVVTKNAPTIVTACVTTTKSQKNPRTNERKKLQPQ